MDLLRQLHVNPKMLPPDSAKAVSFCEALWKEHGRPYDPRLLEEFLDDALHRCAGVVLRYPKVFLLRLKQLQRGEWPPDSQS